MKVSVAFLVAAATAPAMAELSSFELVARHFYPAGYAKGTTTGTPDLFGFGFGSLERSYYDAAQKVFYGGSEIGFVSVSDFGKYPSVTQAPFGIPLEFKLTDIKVCGEHLFVTTKDDPNPGMLHVFDTAKRTADGTLTPPVLIQSVSVLGVGPDNILISKDCMTVATANEGEGVYEDSLINPVGSVTIFKGPFDVASSPPRATLVSLNKWTEGELLAMGVHMPLTLNAMIYWDATGDIDVDFADAIAAYTPDAVLEPEYLAFSADESQIFVNLQENNAMVIVDVASGLAESIHPYGLKTGFAVDVVEDDGCSNMPVVEGLSFLRSADAIASFSQGGKQYIVIANEGDDVAYGDFEERLKAKDIFKGTKLGFTNWTADAAIFSKTNSTQGQSRFFNKNCDDSNAATPWCSGSMRLTVGSAMVDYSNPKAPFIKAMVGIGGRGATIYEVTATGLVMVWDSGDAVEKEGCAAFPWAHNGVQDEEFAPVNGVFYNYLDPDDGLRGTIEELNDPEVDGCEDGGNGLPGACPMGKTIDSRSLKDGYAVETIVTGEACGSMYAVTVSEKNSVGFLYDISVASSPVLASVFHLSPASELLNPGLAYDAGTLGEIDSETIQFLKADQSPTGKAAILFSGAWSGTASLWEFTCVATPAPVASPVKGPSGGKKDKKKKPKSDGMSMASGKKGRDLQTVVVPPRALRGVSM